MDQEKIRRMKEANNLPLIQVPEPWRSQVDYLHEITLEGVFSRYGYPLPDDVVQRIGEELTLIENLDAVNYFLFVHKMVKAAKDELGVWIGPGRGSCAGSIVNYCLDITTIDPIKYDLLYERFMGLDRSCLPDIDLDMDWEGRKKVYAWLKNEYGEDHVAHISTKDGGIHACGIVVTQNPVEDYVPTIYRDDPYNDDTTTLCTKDDAFFVEDNGLIIIDLLGFDVLSEMKEVLALIKEKHHVNIDLNAIPIDDEMTFSIFQNGQTVGIPQFDFDKLRTYLMQLHPTKFEELVAMNCLYRPGLMEFIMDYIERKSHREQLSYEYPFQEKYLSETYGRMLYQEQMMQLAQEVAGLSKEDSDKLRRALQKDKADEIAVFSSKFKQGAIRKGYSEQDAENIWSTFFDSEEHIAKFLFNKSHAVCYTWLSYQAAYLKSHYPEEYMTTIIRVRNNDSEEVKRLTDEIQKIGNNH